MSNPAQKYVVLEKLDSGGMAEVFRGKVTGVQGIEKLVAIKRVLPSLTKNEKFVAMFLDEARLSMRLNHANIVTVFDVGVADNTYFIVMEFVDGVNLRKLLEILSERGIRLPLKVAVFIIMEVCKGLAYAHEKKDQQGRPIGVVHRDISPPNVLISRSGEVKITDFGLAKATTQVEFTDPGVVKGKFSYLSPEAAEGQPVDHRTDIFAAGILLYEIIANRRLFLGKSDYHTVELIRQAKVPSLRKYNSEVDEELEAIVMTALTKEPSQRSQSARQFGDALADYLFNHRMKVTIYDLQEFLGSVLAEEVTEKIEDDSDLLSGIIQQEINNIVSLDLGDVPSFDDGAKPLSDKDLSSAVPSDFDYQLHLHDAYDEEEDDERTIIDVPYHIRADIIQNVDSLEEILEGKDSQAAPSAPPVRINTQSAMNAAVEPRSSFNLYWLIPIVLGLLAGVGAVVYFFVLNK
ncbi:MAG: serine/threonine protein kinase [Myxococcales bacterium]|nr:serine/threonine protein kinase [Myxococcales bacterium]